MKADYLVVRFFDAETPVEVTPFEDKKEAVVFWEQAQLTWSEVFLCKVLDGHEEYKKLMGT